MTQGAVVPDRVLAAASRLRTASLTRATCPPVRDLIDETDAVEAYWVQRLLTEARVRSGSSIVGRKIGLTSAAVQSQLDVDQPDFGVLFDNMDVSDLAVVPFRRLLQPQAEAEIAFVLSSDLDLDRGSLSAEQVRSAVAHAAAAIEIVDSRVTGWDVRFADTVADNASSGLYVLGDQRVSIDRFDPSSAEMTMSIDGVVVSTGRGSDSLGDPLAALAWLARTARDLGDPLRAGQVVLSGALGPMVPISPGASVTASITGLGTVHVEFSGDDE